MTHQKITQANAACNDKQELQHRGLQWHTKKLHKQMQHAMKSRNYNIGVYNDTPKNNTSKCSMQWQAGITT